jgi:rhamnopyranosyl-N-acetylglucosaminyl-diphospho-decaprenol beta-1,3/1,4-galactofuranosyltransferase
LDSQSVAAVVITFNRIELLKTCITALRFQTKKLDEIIVVNNSSTDGTLEWLNDQTDLTIITQENSGSAGGQYTGIKYAFEKGLDWIWCMDDDGLPAIDCLQMLFNSKPNNNEVIGPLVLNKYNKKNLAFQTPVILNNRYVKSTFNLEELKQCTRNFELHNEWATFFNGVLLHKDIISKVGFPLKKLFIWGDEDEYCLRIKSYGICLRTISDALFYHPQNQWIPQKMFFNKYVFTGSFDWKAYCYFRNKGYIAKKYNKYYNLKFLLNHLFYYFFLIKGGRLKKIRFFLKAYLHGINENFSIKLPFSQ